MISRVPIGGKPVIDRQQDAWVQAGPRERSKTVEDTPSKAARRNPARLTIDMPHALRGRIKVAAFNKGITMAEELRQLLEREYPARVSVGPESPR